MRHLTLKDTDHLKDRSAETDVVKQFTAAIRRSGQLDLYWKGKLVYCSDKDMEIKKTEVIDGVEQEVNEHYKYS